MIPFNKPFIIGKELYYIAQAVQSGQLSGDGNFTKQCDAWMEDRFGAKRVLLTHSCTAALEMAAILADIQPGDEVIMPSYTFVSTANAFVLRGGIPVWCDIRPDTLNMDESKVEALITEKTKAIVPVHYGGVSCEMEVIMSIASRYDLLVIEDAAQGVNATYKGRYLGTMGHLGCYSFHETKNLISGEGGALVINDERFLERAEIIREKGTNRAQFFRGEVDKYSWVDVGSSYLPSELVAAFLYAQLEEADRSNERRLAVWQQYWVGLCDLEKKGCFSLQVVPSGCEHNGHLFCLIMKRPDERVALIQYLERAGIKAIFHYVPLHSSPVGQRFGGGDVLPITDRIASRLIRLPMFFELQEFEVDLIIEKIHSFFEER